MGLSEEVQKKMQATLEDPMLSIEQKVSRFKSTVEADYTKRREERANRWTEQENRRDKLWKEMISTDQRIQDLYMDLRGLAKQQTKGKHTEELLNREIR